MYIYICINSNPELWYMLDEKVPNLWRWVQNGDFPKIYGNLNRENWFGMRKSKGEMYSMVNTST